jgi:hypothetical protein
MRTQCPLKEPQNSEDSRMVRNPKALRRLPNQESKVITNLIKFGENRRANQLKTNKEANIQATKVPIYMTEEI